MRLGDPLARACYLREAIGQRESSSGRRQMLSRWFRAEEFCGKGRANGAFNRACQAFCNSELAPWRILDNSDRLLTQHLLRPERRRWSRRQKTSPDTYGDQD